MRQIIFISSLLMTYLVQGNLLAGEASKLENETDRISYSLGQQVGRDLKELGVDLDAAAIMQGFKDASGDETPVVGQQEMTSLLGSLKSRISAKKGQNLQARRELEQKETAEKLRRGREFLTENEVKPGVTTLPSGLQYKVIKSGNGKKPGPKDQVKVSYRYRLVTNGSGEPETTEETDSFRLGGVVPGWTEALLLMGEGSRWELYLPPELAFGKRGPMADQTVIYEIELLRVGDEPQTKKSQTLSNEKTQ